MTNLGQAILHVLNSYLSFSLEIDSSFEPLHSLCSHNRPLAHNPSTRHQEVQRDDHAADNLSEAYLGFAHSQIQRISVS